MGGHSLCPHGVVIGMGLGLGFTEWFGFTSRLGILVLSPTHEKHMMLPHTPCIPELSSLTSNVLWILRP